MHHLTTHNVAHLVDPIKSEGYSPFGFFWVTFLGFSFRCMKSGKVYTKTQIFYKDKVLAIQMAELLEVPKYYDLIDSHGWRDGKPM
jgi:hypothetical protein